MIGRLGWALVLLVVAMATVFGLTLAAYAGGVTFWTSLATVSLTVGIFCAVLAAFHRGRASAWQEVRDLAEREHERVERAREAGAEGGNGGR